MELLWKELSGRITFSFWLAFWNFLNKCSEHLFLRRISKISVWTTTFFYYLTVFCIVINTNIQFHKLSTSPVCDLHQFRCMIIFIAEAFLLCKFPRFLVISIATHFFRNFIHNFFLITFHVLLQPFGLAGFSTC